MFIYVVKIEGVPVAWLVWLNRSANTKYVSSLTMWQWGTSLTYEWRLLPWYISRQRLHCCLARDREAESIRARCYCQYNYSLLWNGMVWLARGMRTTYFSPFKPCLKLRETQYLCCENAFVAKVLTVAGRKTDECILRKLPLPPFASATTFWTPFFLSATSNLCQMAQHQLEHRLDYVAINVTSLKSAIQLACTLQCCQTPQFFQKRSGHKTIFCGDLMWHQVDKKWTYRGLWLMKTLTDLPCNVCPRTWDSKQCQYGSLFSICGTN